MGIQRSYQQGYTTDTTLHDGDNPSNSVGACLTAQVEDGVIRAGHVTIFTDTPEFPGRPDPTSFESVYVHLTPARARELANHLIGLADVLEHRLAR